MTKCIKKQRATGIPLVKKNSGRQRGMALQRCFQASHNESHGANLPHSTLQAHRVPPDVKEPPRPPAGERPAVGSSNIRTENHPLLFQRNKNKREHACLGLGAHVSPKGKHTGVEKGEVTQASLYFCLFIQ